MKKLLYIFILFVFQFNSFAQCKYKYAEEKFNLKNYFAAIDLYKCAYKKVKQQQKADCLWKIAECYRLTGYYKEAAIYYKKAIDANCEQSEIAKSYLSDSTKMQKDKNLIPLKKPYIKSRDVDE